MQTTITLTGGSLYEPTVGDLDAFAESLLEKGEHWLWTGGPSGVYLASVPNSLNRRMASARFSYMTFVGPVDGNNVVRTVCEYQNCVSPSCVVSVTHGEQYRLVHGTLTMSRPALFDNMSMETVIKARSRMAVSSRLERPTYPSKRADYTAVSGRLLDLEEDRAANGSTYRRLTIDVAEGAYVIKVYHWPINKAFLVSPQHVGMGHIQFLLHHRAGYRHLVNIRDLTGDWALPLPF